MCHAVPQPRVRQCGQAMRKLTIESRKDAFFACCFFVPAAGLRFRRPAKNRMSVSILEDGFPQRPQNFPTAACVVACIGNRRRSSRPRASLRGLLDCGKARPSMPLGGADEPAVSDPIRRSADSGIFNCAVWRNGLKDLLGSRAINANIYTAPILRLTDRIASYQVNGPGGSRHGHEFVWCASPPTIRRASDKNRCRSTVAKVARIGCRRTPLWVPSPGGLIEYCTSVVCDQPRSGDAWQIGWD